VKAPKWTIGIIFLFCYINSFAQVDTAFHKKTSLVKSLKIIDSTRQKDLVNILTELFVKDIAKNDSAANPKALFSLVPALGYSLSTGVAFDLTANVAFHTDPAHNDKLSTVDGVFVYDTKEQRVFASRAEIWFDNDNYKFISDFRAERYPIDTYGLGTSATQATINSLDYSYVKSYVTMFKKIAGALYGGFGYRYDHYYDIRQEGNANGTVSQFTEYGFSRQSTSSGAEVALLFDNRLNSINPQNGEYAYFSYRDNFTFLGSNHNWQEFQLDLRKYFKLSRHSNNILAIWSLMAFTIGDAPYLDLPSTGTDTHHTSGRGYTEQRFRGKNELYIEAEYRYGITRNGLIGGVVFSNFQSFSEFKTNRFVKIAPAAGAGLRVKINKESNTNVGIDYGWGIYNSHGLFVNLGEYF